nr:MULTISPECIES: PIN domain-containing protein [unclassified Methanoculleus]
MQPHSREAFLKNHCSTDSPTPNFQNVLSYGSETILSAHEIRDPHRVHFWDALLAATMIESRIDTIVTEDAHLLRIPGITVVNPYREG